MGHDAIVRLLMTCEGGRCNPTNSGYKPQLKIGNDFTSCIIKKKDERTDVMNLGEEYYVTIELQFERIYRECLKPNMILEFYEGSKLVGQGRMI